MLSGLAGSGANIVSRARVGLSEGTVRSPVRAMFSRTFLGDGTDEASDESREEPLEGGRLPDKSEFGEASGGADTAERKSTPSTSSIVKNQSSFEETSSW